MSKQAVSGLPAGTAARTSKLLQVDTGGTYLTLATVFAQLVQADILTALGYTPIGPAGGTLTGPIIPTINATFRASGTTQATAAAISSQFNVVTLGSGGVQIPANVGVEYTILNRLGATLTIYPVTGANFEGLAANAGVMLANNGSLRIRYTTGTQGYVY